MCDVFIVVVVVVIVVVCNGDTDVGKCLRERQTLARFGWIDLDDSLRQFML